MSDLDKFVALFQKASDNLVKNYCDASDFVKENRLGTLEEMGTMFSERLEKLVEQHKNSTGSHIED